MTKVIIQHGKYRGLYEIIHLQCQRFFIVRWWKTVSITEHFEEEAILKLAELMKSYKIKQRDICDWSGDNFYMDVFENPAERQFKTMQYEL
jgi:hypothetical protein